MTYTPNLALPLLAGSQAQKHVTVNEGLMILDGLSPLVIASRSQTSPTGSEAAGSVFFLPAGSVNQWAGQDGKLAVKVNEGWRFVTPKAGWQAFVVDEAAAMRWDGGAWVDAGSTVSGNGAATTRHVLEVDHTITAGTTNTTTLMIPSYAMVNGVTGRVLTDITGTLVSWDLGVAAATNRYANGIGLSQGSWINGPSGQPITYYSAEAITLTADGGSFATGSVRLALHYDIMTPPSA